MVPEVLEVAALRCRSSFQEVNMAQDTSAVNTRTRPDREGMTRDEILALFDRRQKAYDDLDATRLAADYAPSASVDASQDRAPNSGAVVFSIRRDAERPTPRSSSLRLQRIAVRWIDTAGKLWREISCSTPTGPSTR
jgi:hypothetical protein